MKLSPRYAFLPILAIGTGMLLLAPHVAHADVLGFPTSIVPEECNCPNGAGWGCVLLVIGNVFQFAIALGIFGFVGFAAYAGFTWVLNPINPELRKKASGSLMNAAIGLVIVLAAWLIVNTLITTLTKGSVESYTAELGKTSGLCLPTATDVSGGAGITTGFGSTDVALASGTGACSSQTVQSAAATGGYAISSSEAQVLACLAKPESSCGANTTGAKTSDGKSTSAAGPWQNILSYSDKCHSLNLPPCGNLQCSDAFSGGKAKAGQEELAKKCIAAANNLNCAASAAACLVQANGGYGAWTGTGDGYTHAAQKQCVSKYGGK